MTIKSDAAGASTTNLLSANPFYQDYLHHWRKLTVLLTILEMPPKNGHAEARMDMLNDSLSSLFRDKKRLASVTVSYGGITDKKTGTKKNCGYPCLTFRNSKWGEEKTLCADALTEFVRDRVANMKFILQGLESYDPQDIIEKHWFEADDREKMTQSMKDSANVIKNLDIDVSKRFAMEKILGMTPNEIVYNEHLLAEEKQVTENTEKTAPNTTFDDYLYRWRKLVCLLAVLQKPIKDIGEIGGKVDMLRDCLPVLLPDKKDEKSAQICIRIVKKDELDKSCEGGCMTHDSVVELVYGEKTLPSINEKGEENPQLDTRTKLNNQQLIEFVEKRIANLKFVLTAIQDYEPETAIEREWFGCGKSPGTG